MDGIGWILTVVISGLLLISVPIAVALGMGVLITMHFLSLPPIFFTPKLFGALDTFALVAIPFFILSGEIMQRGSMAKALLNVSRCMVGHVTGGLAHISVLTCLFYGALCGSGPATTAAVGGFMIPSMIKGGYPRVFSTAVSTVGGCLGVMIPPSVPLILYGASAGLSISNLFIAAIIPGIFVGALLIIVCYFICLFYKYGTKERMVTFKTFLHSLYEAKYAIMVPLIVLGGIYGGITTPTEAGCIAVVYAVIVECFITKKVNLNIFIECLAGTVKTSSIIFFIVAVAVGLGHLLMYMNIPDMIVAGITSITTDKNMIMLLLIGLILICGMFVDGSAMLLVLTPLILPILKQTGIDPTHFGIVFLLALAIGFVTPPVGVNLFVGCGVGKVSIEKLSWGSLPLVGAMLLALLVVAYVPELSLCLL